jgi:hypothetical protein
LWGPRERFNGNMDIARKRPNDKPAYKRTSLRGKHMKERELYDFLKALPTQIGANHITLLTSNLPRFLEILGYEGSNIFFGFLLSLSDRVEADALVAEHRSSRPWVIVKVKTFETMRNDPKRVWEAAKLSYLRFLSVDDQWLLLFSPKILGLASVSQAHFCDLTRLTEDQSSEIYSLLRRPSKRADGSGKRPSEVGTEAPL